MVKKMLKVYTDGAYSFNNNIGGWAIFFPDLNIKICNNLENTTNNVMEITAGLEALKFFKISNLYKYFNLEVYSDSMYLIGTINNNWKKNKNENIWNELDELLNFFKENNSNIKFVHVKGHSGNFENEICDNIAVNLTK